ncbi:hypothetical protein VE03_03187 [Pseudogymnoascus sp. 23342-1-I1]|nr:hypothetical protein VE03_03187 [Pseudogymnoascus sp. 23342-1-I1]
MPAPRIAIIGAGPGGLTLARLLQHNGIQCTIFELDQERSSRNQGGMVDLHAGTGQLALREAGLWTEFEKNARPEAEAMKLIKSDGTVIWDENDMESVKTSQVSRDRPEIDRAVLRDILLDSIQPGSIQWNRKLVRVEPLEDHTFNLHFTDSSEHGFDLVVGADGAWSKVRPLLTDREPFYSGISIIELEAKEASVNKPWLSNFTGLGSCFMFDEGRALICQQNGNDTIRVYAGVRQSETWIKECGIDWEQQDLARKNLAELYFGDCHEDLKRVIAHEATDGLIPRPLYMLPVGLIWEPRPGVTLLGDAAHLMTPFAGVGVNIALADALDLARALVKRKGAFESDLQGAIGDATKEYEGPMFERSKENMEKTSTGLQLHFSADGIDHRVKRLRARAKHIEERARAAQQSG